MTAKELVDGLRERGYVVSRMHRPVVIIPWLKPDDRLRPWLEEIGCGLVEYKPDATQHPEVTAFEVRLQRARVDVGEGDPSTLASLRAVAVWDAAGPPPRPVTPGTV